MQKGLSDKMEHTNCLDSCKRDYRTVEVKDCVFIGGAEKEFNEAKNTPRKKR